ncbi:hypothetical protein [Streptomyces sp. CRN 30]|uniref:hypothetical protein n=1 Tax=Streptomyces sp. CRN 30 TaxID=3075613 RepID=UPI002A8063E8|nr:hypothetical protein [Streptomyces sp. CRN 30]
MGASTWDEALEGFTTEKVVTRADVTGMTWLGSPHVDLSRSSPLVAGQDYDLVWNGQMTDGRWISAGINLANIMWQDDSELGKYWRQTWNILGPVASTPTGNTVVKYGSFSTAADSVQQVLDMLAAQHDRLITWGQEIDEDDSPAQGSAAAAFKAALTSLAGQLENLRHQVLAQGDPVGMIREAGTALQVNSRNLGNAYDAWRNTPGAVPYQVLAEVWLEICAQPVTLSRGAHNVVTGVVLAGLGSLSDAATWKALEAKAKERWLQNLTALDTAAVTCTQNLATAYQGAVQAIPASLTAPKYRTPYQEPASDDPASDDPSADDPTADGPTSDDTTVEDPSSTAPELETGTGGADTGELDSGASGYTLAGSGTGSVGSDLLGSGGGTGSELLGGGTGSSGQQLLDANGDVVTDTEGNPVTAPAGSVLNPNGTVTKPDGTLLTDSKGNVVRVPSGGSLGSGLTSGIKRTTAVTALAAQEAAQEAAYQRALKNARASSGVLGESLGTAALKSTGTETARLGGVGTGSVAPYLGGGSSAAKLRTATTSTEGVRAVAGEVPRETTAGSRTTSTNGSPSAMPPGSGMGAGGGTGGRDRDRRTWLDEDEETWGTTQSRGAGVIG